MHSEFLSIPKYSLPNFRYKEDRFRECAGYSFLHKKTDMSELKSAEGTLI